MVRKLKQSILEDFNDSYSIEIDKESLKKQYISSLDTNHISIQNDKINYWKKLSYSLCGVMVVLLCVIVTGIVLIGKWSDSEGMNDEEIMTEEFRAFMKENTDIYGNKYIMSYNISKNIDLYIYTGDIYSEKDSRIVVYSYIIKGGNDTSDTYIIINDNKEQVKDDDYGIITEVPYDHEHYEISFIIEKNGKQTKYSITK